MLRDYARLGIGSLFKRKLRSWLTMIGIFIGIAAVVSLISLGQGMQAAIEEQFFQLGADKVNIAVKGPNTGPPGSNSDVQLFDSDLAVVQRVKGVDVATGRLVEPIRAEFNDKEIFLFVATLAQDDDERELLVDVANVDEDNMLYGRTLKPSDQWKVIMSENYLEPKFDGKGLKVGDKVRINGQTVDVVGIFKKTGNPFVDISFVMNENAVRDLLDIPEKYGLLLAKISSDANIRNVANAIEKDLRNHRGLDEGDEDFEINTAEDVLDTLSTVLTIVTAVLVGIAAISLIVGGIGIMNTMYTSVLERQGEIGVMKAIGARNSDVLTIFMIESGMLGMVGGAIGILCGVLLSKFVEFAATAALGTTLIQAQFPWYLILGALLFSFGVGSIAGVFPALQASQLTPVEALKE
ncbi:MAG: ABC transporter permease [Candidatus Woesearchaeota archaeon]|nr:ABC transporter permease [Candidatus Woesearchaeota archaeon]